MSDALPSTDRPLTDDERLRAACDWSDYRKDYGVDLDALVRGKEHQAFLAGWTARHRETALPTAADQPTTEPSAVEHAAETLDRVWSEHHAASNAWARDTNPATLGDCPSAPTSLDLAQALADAGLLAPAPQPAADLGDLTTWTPAEVAASPVGASRLIQRLDAVVTAVREVHAPQPLLSGQRVVICQCCLYPHPCATVRALDGGAA